MQCRRWIAFLSIFLTTDQAVGGDILSLKVENQLLEAELRTAHTPQIYSIFDLKHKKVRLKARGLLLRELRIEEFRVWGNLPAVKTATLIRKTALFAPGRRLVSPQTAEDKEQTRVEILELKDMPTNYTLVLEENLSISVRPQPRGTISSLWSMPYAVRWYLTRPVVTVWYTVWRKPFASIEIALEKDEARSLYWSFLEGMKGIVFLGSVPGTEEGLTARGH